MLSDNVVTNNIMVLYDSGDITYQYARRFNKSELATGTIDESLFYALNDYLNKEESIKILTRIESAATVKNVKRISIPPQFYEDDEKELVEQIEKAKEDRIWDLEF